MVSRVRASLAPTSPANSRPTSRRSSGIDQLRAIAFAVSDLPVPWGPTSRTPRGVGNPKRRASSEKACWRCCSQFFKASRPPMASVPVCVAQNSSTSLRAMLWRFSSSTSFRSSAPSCPRRASARAATWRTRSSLSPLQARVSSARTDGSSGEPLLRLMLLSRLRRSSASGNGRSSSVRASSRSAGGFQLPLHSTRVWVVLRRLWCRLRSILAMPGSSQKRWKSFSSRMVGLALSRSRSHWSTAIGWRLPVPSALSTPWSPSMKSQLARRCRSFVAV